MEGPIEFAKDITKWLNGMSQRWSLKYSKNDSTDPDAMDVFYHRYMYSYRFRQEILHRNFVKWVYYTSK
ncbi:hypothetical protein MKW98_021368 [Papaver atlanticum]|uniref:Uncharacterized protein n=1 Tax=Papaver atlanticum TaxID=357466 RepID=A0AAD4SRS5_9MAGN|nr:hypothetical protein MKW98_021368 [Papaver atlanticum]